MRLVCQIPFFEALNLRIRVSRRFTFYVESKLILLFLELILAPIVRNGRGRAVIAPA